MKWVSMIVIAAFLAVITIYVSNNYSLEMQVDKQMSEEDVPMILTGDVAGQSAFQLTDATTTLSLLVIAFSVIMQLIAWIAAVQKLGAVKKSGMGIDERFMQLDAIEIYFDLPLYFGLFGTVLSFILITLYPEAGLMFAYVSTALGILVAVILRLFLLTPYRQELISRGKTMTGIS